ncbi:MAG: serine/threonine protein kinase, partial [Planctomycetes bacterium]|nr:serine/threonine protein kinase [Planctomycetota bacterium]
MTAMADPPLETFVATLRRSRLFDPADLDRLAGRLPVRTAREFADALIRTNDLTRYQADKLLRGRWQGLVLGPYQILVPLGRGGMGTVVYLARDRRMTEALGDSVLLALKVLPNRKAVADPKVLARFRREMEVGRRLNHPNVVRSFANGDLEDVHFLALEYVPGKTVRHVVGEKGPMPFGEAARVFADVANGLAHVHERGLVHRDVKPTNIMVRPDGRAVLLDMGLAFAPDEPLPADPAIAGGRGYVVGTLDFLAPEQAKNPVAVGPAADLYGLGCSLFYALTGTLPFPAEGTKQKIRRHRNDPPPGVANVPSGMAHLVKWLLAKTPADRPGSAVRVRDLLQTWATAPNAPVTVNVVAEADAAVLDPGLWDATPGEELPFADPVSEANPFALPDEVNPAVGKARRAASPRPNNEAMPCAIAQICSATIKGGGLVPLRCRPQASSAARRSTV